jgi:putative membrane-bound dehydrogenase-like protein
MTNRSSLNAAALCAIACACFLADGFLIPRANSAEPVEMEARARAKVVSGDAEKWTTELRRLAWDPAKTAIVVCDMWDLHHCKNATDRVAEMAPRMNEVLKAGREQGMLIIHCPSDTMAYYEGTPQRKLAQSAPPVETKVPLQRWCFLDEKKEALLPIDDTDGGCDTPADEAAAWEKKLEAMGRNPKLPWKRQIETLEIYDGDAITDSGEAYYLMRQKGITNVIVMGVHTNMCVLGRPFSIRQMVNQGQNVVLMRDMTDTMYNPAMRPKVTHFAGTDLVIEHIERYWCPTITSAELLGGEPFRFSGDDPNRKEASVDDLAAAAPSGAIYRKWSRLAVPGVWDERSSGALAGYDGVAWYRCVVRLPAGWAGKDLELFVEKVDDAHEAYFDGQRIGESGAFPPAYASGLETPKRYAVPGALATAGDHVVAIRVYDHGGRGGFKGLSPALFNERSVIELAGKWQFRLGNDSSSAMPTSDEERKAMPFFERVVRAAEIAPREVGVVRQEGYLPPEEAAKKLRVADDLTLTAVLTEPTIQQPLFLDFDERGRMWVAEYRQYPHPAGLKMLSRDDYWRAVYDRIPPPPPDHFRGADRISIHEDTNGDGTFDSHKIFVDGLNIATSFARGRGGVFVLNPPYLLFYPDADVDDVPDSDPEVLLEGFGLEDTHSVANNLTWGPDGWIYGAQGSTVSAAIRRYGSDEPPIRSAGQLIWRYQPEQRRFEIFAEGGGNAFGIEIDEKGRLFSGHNGGDTRGFHYLPGAYLQKGFSKHGPLSNPYAFGYFPQMTHHSAARFSHDWIVYEAMQLPERYRGKLLGVEPLQGQIVESEITPVGSTFATKDLSRPIASDDPWFRPVHIALGTDGAVYVADWYDAQVNHYRNHEGKIDPGSGRIYRLAARDQKLPPPANLDGLSSEELVRQLASPNREIRKLALRLLADRRDESVVPTLRAMLISAKADSPAVDAAGSVDRGQLALEALWALNLTGGLDDETALQALGHDDPYVRLWTARLVCDDREVSAPVSAALVDLAKRETNLEVRAQLACSARRLPRQAGLPLLFALWERSEGVDDPQLPLLCWWALETQITSDPDATLDAVTAANLWEQPIFAKHLAERLMRRFAAPGTREDLLRAAKLLTSAPKAVRAALLAGFEQEFAGRSLAGVPDGLVDALIAAGGESLSLKLRRGDAEALAEATRQIADDSVEAPRRIELIETLGRLHIADSAKPLLDVFRNEKDAAIRIAALNSLQAFDDPQIAKTVLAELPKLEGAAREAAESLLSGRVAAAAARLEAMESGEVPASSVSLETGRRMLLLPDEKLAARVRTFFPSLQGPTAAELEAAIAKRRDELADGVGNPYHGKELYRQQCGKCHVLHGEGGAIGPDLTPYQRRDLAALLLAVTNPSAEIREGFETVAIVTDDGRSVTGFVADQDDRTVVVRGTDGRSTIVERDSIEQRKVVPQSVMPSGLLDAYDPQAVRDLFAYLRSSQPLND